MASACHVILLITAPSKKMPLYVLPVAVFPENAAATLSNFTGYVLPVNVLFWIARLVERELAKIPMELFNIVEFEIVGLPPSTYIPTESALRFAPDTVKALMVALEFFR